MGLGRRRRLKRLAWLAAATPPAVPLVALPWHRPPYLVDLAAQTSHLFIVIAVLVVIGLLLRRSWRGAAALGAATTLAAGLFVCHADPHASPLTQALPGSRPLRAVFFNAHGVEAPDYTPFLDWALSHAPDVIGVVEGPLSPDSIVERLRAAGYERHNYREREYAELWSRLPARPYPEYWPTGVPSYGGSLPFLVTPSDGQPFLVCVLQFSSPRREASWQSGLDLSAFHGPLIHRASALSKLPVIVGGDFNVSRIGRLYGTFMAASGLVDADTSRLPTGTWPTWAPARLGVAIDHCWVSRDVAVSRFETGPDVGSDHRPIFVELAIPPMPSP